jgi:S1/P1 Nuclease
MSRRNVLGLTRGIRVVVLACLVLAQATTCFGWGDGGHMMVAHIAHERLNDNAKAQADKLLSVQINPAAITATSLDFVNASHWADDVKKLPDFDFSPDLHFVDFPFFIDQTKLQGQLPKQNNILTGLAKYVKVLRTSTDEADRAEALRFIIHFVGDIHQPLHCATRVDHDHPGGDIGGNQTHLKITQNGATTKVKLHTYWDDGLFTFPKTGPNFTPPPLSEIPPAAATALEGNPDTDPKLKLNMPFDFKGWATESSNLARNVAYKGIVDGQPAPNGYEGRGVPVARQRVAWAGYRLAALLNAIWPK